MNALGALAGFGVAVAMLLGVELTDRFDRWMRSHGLGWLMIGSRDYAVAMKWLFRILLSALGVFCLVLFFERL